MTAPDFPPTRFSAPGGPNAEDVANQPGDVSFVIDSLLVPDAQGRPRHDEVDSERIGVMGLSLGGLTATLVGFHPRW